jgi:hypothetical protein
MAAKNCSSASGGTSSYGTSAYSSTSGPATAIISSTIVPMVTECGSPVQYCRKWMVSPARTVMSRGKYKRKELATSSWT